MKNEGLKKEKRYLFLLIISSLIFLGACQEDERPEIELNCLVEGLLGPEDDVVGKWKLVKERKISIVHPEIEVRDYSCDNIYYHFKQEGKLEIQNNVEGGLYGSGTYDYEFIPPADSETQFILELENYQWRVAIEGRIMTFNMALVDEPVKYFIRMELI